MIIILFIGLSLYKWEENINFYYFQTMLKQKTIFIPVFTFSYFFLLFINVLINSLHNMYTIDKKYSFKSMLVME